MQIDPLTARPLPPLDARPAGKPCAGDACSAAAGGFQPTADLAGWLSAVRAELAVRADVVAEARVRLAAGELFTAEAAAATAAAMLSKVD